MIKTTLRLLCVATLAANVCLAAEPKTVEISSNDQMKFSVTAIEAGVGQSLVLVLKNAGTLPKAAMGHNLIILKPGTDVTAFATAAMTQADKGYIPAEMADKIVAHTQLLGPGESETLTVSLTQAGEYPYLCSFPGHALTGMKGVISVK